MVPRKPRKEKTENGRRTERECDAAPKKLSSPQHVCSFITGAIFAGFQEMVQHKWLLHLEAIKVLILNAPGLSLSFIYSPEVHFRETHDFCQLLC